MRLSPNPFFSFFLLTGAESTPDHWLGVDSFWAKKKSRAFRKAETPGRMIEHALGANYAWPSCFAISSAKFSCFFSRPSPRS